MRKKKKSFPKEALLNLYDSSNYQKVISKIKQFNIDGMSEDEVNILRLNSIKKLSFEFFLAKDLTRMLKLLNQALDNENSDETFMLYRLYGFCYNENFNEAIKTAQTLINSKVSYIKKEAIFYLILSQIYLKEFDFDKSLLTLLTKSKQNYILGFLSLMQEDIKNALKYFKETKPRYKIEKNNVATLIAIIENREFENSETKPIYKALLTGDTGDLYSSKNSREATKEINNLFKKRQVDLGKKSFLEYKSPLAIEEIKKDFPKEKWGQAIFNNMLIHCQKHNLEEAYRIFNSNSIYLYNIPESIFLVLNIVEGNSIKKKNNTLITFLDNYLKHNKKLPQYQLNYIFSKEFSFLEDSSLTKITNLAKEYNAYALIIEFTPFLRLTILPKEESNKVLKDFFKNYYPILLPFLDELLFDWKREMLRLQDSKEKASKTLDSMISSMEEVKESSKKYVEPILLILNSIALVLIYKNFEENRELYLRLDKIMNYYIEIFNIDYLSLDKTIKTLKISIKEEKSFLENEKSPEEEVDDIFGNIDINSPLEVLSLILKDSSRKEEYSMKDFLDNEIFLKDLEYVLKNGQDDKDILSNYKIDIPIKEEILLLLKVFKIYEKYVNLNLDKVNKIIESMDVDIFEYRREIHKILKEADFDFIYKKYLIEAVISYSFQFKYTQQWFFSLIIYYLEGIVKDNLKSKVSDDFYKYLVKEYPKKAFKQIASKYKNIVKLYKV